MIEAGIGDPRDAQRDARAGQIDRAVQKMRARHQHHAGTNRDEAQRGTELQADGDRPDRAGQQRGGERLHEQVVADPANQRRRQAPRRR